MKIELQQFDIPFGGKIIKNDFYKYDPITSEFTRDKNLLYLKEDLLQIEFESLGLLVDLGWYGEISKNDGDFKIYIIRNQNWEEPLKIYSSKSQKQIIKNLNEILKELKQACI